MAALAAQQTLCRLSDNPRQLTEPRLAAFRSAAARAEWRQQLDVMNTPF
jgi:hypothetical protein